MAPAQQQQQQQLQVARLSGSFRCSMDDISPSQSPRSLLVLSVSFWVMRGHKNANSYNNNDNNNNNRQ